MVGTYSLKVFGIVESRVVEMTFNLIVSSSCGSAFLEIDDTLFKTADNTITQSIWQPRTTLTWTDTIITVKDVLNNIINCGTLSYEFLEPTSSTYVSTSEITYDIAGKTLSMQTDLLAKVGSYPKKIKVSLTSWPAVQKIKDFKVEFINTCAIPT